MRVLPDLETNIKHPNPPRHIKAIMNKDAIFQIIAEHSREVLPALANHVFEHQQQLAALGANSMDRADIIIMTLESLGLKIPLLAVTRANNLGELTDLLYEHLQAR
jgi:polyketide biosynthesis acyl carrier protein